MRAGPKRSTLLKVTLLRPVRVPAFGA